MAVLPSEVFDTCTSGLFTCMAQWANVTTGGWFWTLALAGFIAAIFIATQRYGTNRAFAFSGFICITGSSLLALTNLMDWGVASIFIILGAVSLIAMINSEK